MNYELLVSVGLLGIILYIVVSQSSLPPTQGKLNAIARQHQFCTVLETIPYTIMGKEVIFEIMDNSCESGMPHTINSSTIRFPKSLWEQRDSDRFKQILRHEIIHLLQRQFPTAWRVEYKKWGYILQKNPPAGIPVSIADRVRFNPDLADATWAIYEDRYVTVACYKSVSNPQLRETEIVIWDLELGKQIETMPESWKWKGMHQAEHPHELSAEMGADLANQAYIPEGFVEFLRLQYSQLNK
jgi:hypothetical protein